MWIQSGRLTNGHAPGKGLNGTLGTRVDGVLGDTLGLAGDGAHEDDAATDFHALVGGGGNEELATGVDVEDAVKLLGSDVLEVAKGHDTRVGAANVELAKVGDNVVHELLRLVDIADVGLEGRCVGAVAKSLDLLDDLLSTLDGVGVVDGDLCAALGKLNGHSLSDTTA